ncbi:hypothetical protein BCR32DRAFT_275893 [Anaeromyces robustus]|uniref:RGS domain-containing protein n=1 Tax=Anaeromyces robustus TaxID=1754192 RepID=A0A1Y1XJP5_9FUNG|nr:hypothetical protein BCR32DRAFT_275893 [Anaeromyces robustus]|eukprot:ORX85933.1 hypothetical protein BCR32DRAFT_275893 [Anaeromyces robustus]
MNDYFPFPKDWIKEDSTIKQYEKCSSFYRDTKSFQNYYDNKSWLFYVISWFFIIYNIGGSFLILKNNRNFEILKFSKVLIIIHSLSLNIAILNTYFRNVLYDKYPCFLVNYCITISHVLNYLSIISCVLYYLNLNNNYVGALRKTLFSRKKSYNLLYKLYKDFTEIKMVSWMLIITSITLFFSSYLGSKNKEYSLYPMNKGYCLIYYGGIPQTIILICYLIFIPLAIIEIKKMGVHFSFRISFIISLILSFVFLIIHNIFIIGFNYECSSIFRHIPYDIFYNLSSIAFSFLQIFRLLVKLYYSKQAIKQLDLTKSSLFHVLDDKILYEEFVDYCFNLKCIEYMAFYTEYKKFISLFDVKYNLENSVNHEEGKESNKNYQYYKDDDNDEEVNNDSIIIETNFYNNNNNNTFNMISNKHFNDTTINIKYNDSKININIPSTIPSIKYYEKLASISNGQNINNNNNIYNINDCNNNNNFNENNNNNNHINNNNSRNNNNNGVSDTNNNLINYSMKNTKNSIKYQKHSFKKDKRIQYFDTIHYQLNTIVENFIMENSELELNLPDSISKNIKKNTEIFNNHYLGLRYQMPYIPEKLNVKHIFDDAYEEVIEILYLNIFSGFVLSKKKNQNSK